MRSFFGGWRQKTSVLTLILAFGFCFLWSRSLDIRDTLNFRRGSTEIAFFASNFGKISWRRLEESEPFQMTFDRSYSSDRADPQATDEMFATGDIDWHWTFGGFHAGKVVIPTTRSTMIVTAWEMPYSAIVVPLVLICSLLQLNGARKSDGAPLPATCEDALAAAAEPQTRRKFRWRMVPAALNWGFGGIFLVSIPFIIIFRWNDLTVLPEIAGTPSLADLACLAMAGIAMGFAARRWVQGKWMGALLFDAIVYALLLFMASCEPQPIREASYAMPSDTRLVLKSTNP